MDFANIVNLFERPLPFGWLYPCSLQDIASSLSRLPIHDLEGLWAVGLVPSTQKENTADARYFSGEKPTIHVYSYRETLNYKQPPHVKQGDIEQGLAIEMAYGMCLEMVGRRWICQWSRDNLRRFILDHVLIHEIGHHVFHQQRLKQKLTASPSARLREQFAEDYARRHSQLRNT